MQSPFDFQYTHAIVCRLPNSLKDLPLHQSLPQQQNQQQQQQQQHRRVEPLDIQKANELHNEYIALLRKLGLDVIELQADETLPECPFVDCMSIICNGTALIAKPYFLSRKKEVQSNAFS